MSFECARAHVCALMTRKSCTVGMRNAILRNYLKCGLFGEKNAQMSMSVYYKHEH